MSICSINLSASSSSLKSTVFRRARSDLCPGFSCPKGIEALFSTYTYIKTSLNKVYLSKGEHLFLTQLLVEVAPEIFKNTDIIWPYSLKKLIQNLLLHTLNP